MSIQERIIQSRNQAGISQTQLANIAGLAQSQISQYEAGSRSPSSKPLLKLAAALNVTPDYLLYGQKPTEFTLSEDDKDLLKTFRMLSSESKQSVLDFVKFMAFKNSK